MRLIDADKINFNQDDTEVVFEVLHAEPIEAIPVEWLKDYAHFTLLNSCDDHNIVEWFEEMLKGFEEDDDYK